MKFNYKKIASVLASAIMLSSTIGFAAAVGTYPAPFVAGGTANGAVIVGANAAPSDWALAIDVGQKLSALVSSGTTSTNVATTGETAALFTSSSKINVNDTLRQVKTVLTKSELPTVLKDQSFSGNVDATLVQTIDLGTNPAITFAKQPVSTNDPRLGLTVATSTNNVIYNSSVTFNKAVNLSHADSEGQEITLFGQKFTIAAATSDTDLVLLKSAQKVSLTSDSPTAEVTVGGKTYTIELISSSDTAATIAVTDDAGTTESKEVSEAASKKINGLTIAVNTADETNLKLSASVIAGAEKMTFTSGGAVTTGDSATSIEGTLVTMTGGVGAMTKLVIGIAAKNSDNDAIMPGETFVDPVFGTFKIDFSGGLNIADTFTDNAQRESFEVRNVGDDKMSVKFKNHKGNEATVQFAKNTTHTMQLAYDDDIKNITVLEKESILKNGYVVVGNQDEGYLLRVSTLTNSSAHSNDKIVLTDVFDTSSTYTATITAEGVGTITIGGKVYNVYGNITNVDSDSIVLDYPDSSAAGSIIAYPTIQTSKGAKIAFYEPLTINLVDVDGRLATTTAATQLKIPDGDGYTDFTLTHLTGAGNWTIGTQTINTTDPIEAGNANLTVGRLIFTAVSTAVSNQTKLYLRDPTTPQTLIRDPALIIFEEKDDATNYEAIVITLETGATSTDGIGVDDIIRTWGGDSVWDATALASKSTHSKEVDLFGTIALVDTGDSDQATAIISYPDEQLYAQLYIGTEASAITPGTSVSGGGGQVLVVKDTQVDSVKDKNLFVVGGSCINEVAAKILGASTPVCGADFTNIAKISAGGYIIKTVESPYSATKVATLVAGYNADDTSVAVAKALTGVATDKDTSITYPELSTGTTTTTE
ncbi:MAG: hypothetical protein AABX54_00775 [Nanoarchaeota archaeon]